MNSAEPAIVIPNRLDETAQDDLLLSIESLGPSVRFLWRPVAAVIHWIERQVRDDNGAWLSKMKDGGKVFAIHLGVDGFEYDLLDIVSLDAPGTERFVPARRRPIEPTAPWLGVDLLETLSYNCLSRAGEVDLRNSWRMTWVSPWSIWARRILGGGRSASACEERATAGVERLGLESALIRGIRPAWDRMAETLYSLHKEVSGDKPGSLREFRAARGLKWRDPDLWGWVERGRDLMKKGAGDVIGCMATGSFASFPVQGTTFALSVVKHVLGRVPDRTLVEAPGGEDANPLARGAALYAARLAAGVIGYYDTLPRLQVLTLKMGEPHWSHLLKEDDKFVEGGKPFEPEDRKGFFIRANEATVVLQVVLGKHPTVRSIDRRLPRKAESNESIRLRVSMEPARGNAKVRIVPENPRFLEGQPPIYLDWKTSRDTRKTPEQVIREQPRMCPPTEPRPNSPDLWQKMVGGFAEDARILQSSRSDERIQSVLLRAKACLQRRDSRLKRATAVSSEGTVSMRQEVLDEYFEAVSGLLSGGARYMDLFLRVLAYGSSGSEILLKYLMKNICSPMTPAFRRAWVFACGECLRDPEDIACFVEELRDKLNTQKWKGQGGRNVWLQSLAKILMYRERACEFITSDTCLEVTRLLLREFTEELSKGNCKYVFRHSALCIVFLLRRRAFDAAYLPPNFELAEKIKNAFRDAKRKAEEGRVILIGGAVDLPTTLQRLIDYIDQRGQGTISEGLFDTQEKEDEDE